MTRLRKARKGALHNKDLNNKLSDLHSELRLAGYQEHDEWRQSTFPELAAWRRREWDRRAQEALTVCPPMIELLGLVVDAEDIPQQLLSHAS